MSEISTSEIERYLKSIQGASARILSMKLLGGSGKEEIKEYGYGKPMLIAFESAGTQQRAVLHTVSPGPFGHEHMADRAQMLLWDHSSFNNLPRHLRSIDVGAFRRNGTAVSLGDAEEFFELTEYVEGRGYFEDFMRMRDS